MNGYAVQHGWVQFVQEQRERETRDRRERERLQTERVRKASVWVVEELPDLVIDGRVCSWAIMAALQIAAEARRGEVRFSAAAVRARRREELERLLARTGMTAEELRLTV